MKTKVISRGLLIYITILNFTVCYLLGTQIGDIIEKGNIYSSILLLVNLFTLIFNIAFLSRKRSAIKWKSILLYNSFFSVISSVGVRLGGIIVSNLLGIDISLIVEKNQTGFHWGYQVDKFNAIIQLLFYDVSQAPGMALQVNLIMVAIGLTFFLFSKKVLTSDPLTVHSK